MINFLQFLSTGVLFLEYIHVLHGQARLFEKMNDFFSVWYIPLQWQVT